MIINCTYTTQADIGDFETNATLDTKTLEVLDIESSEEEGVEDINFVKSEKINFVYEDKEYEFKVKFTDSSYELEEGQDFSVFNSINLKTNLDADLKEKNLTKNKKKI